MKDFNQIDELLKEQMQDFTPDVPAEVWTQISSNLPAGAAPAPVNPATGLTFGIKSAIIAGIAVVAGASYFLSGGNETSAVSENSQLPKTVEAPKTEIVQNNPVEEALVEKEEKPVIRFTKPTPIRNTEEKTGEAINLTRPVTTGEHIKSENLANQESHPAKYDNLLTHDAKTEVVEGDPEQENTEDVNREEHKSNEAEKKKDQPIVHNVLTPNGDGLNDEVVIEMPPVDFYHLRIFTKKGTLVFESDNIQTRWKGLILGSGIQSEPGDYRYILEYQLKGKENVKVMGGYIYLNP